MKKIQAKLSCHRNRMTKDLELTKTHLIDKWTKGNESGETRIKLSKRSPDLSYTTGRSDSLVAQLIGCCICLGIASIFFFSVIQEKVPLLSVAFYILAFWLFIKAIRGMRIQTWTIIHRETGEQFAWFTHGDCTSQEISRILEK